MKCLILAAGYATRLYPLTENYPKPLLMVQNRHILDWLISDIDSNMSISQFVIISNHKFVSHFNEWRDKSNICGKIVVLDDGSTENENRLGAVRDIKFAIDKMNIDEDVLVIAGDNLLDFSMSDFYKYYLQKDATCIMRHFEDDINKLRRTGVATINGDELVTEMEEKPHNPQSTWAVPPFYIYKKTDLKYFGEQYEGNYGIDAPGSFISWLCSMTKVYAYEMPGRRYDIGNLETYNRVNEEYRGIS